MAYTDLTASFSYNQKLRWTDFNAMAVNAKLAYDTLTNSQFSAYNNAAQTINSGAARIINFNTEEYDTASNYDTTNFRFLPTVAGKYFICAAVTFDTSGSYAEEYRLAIHKSGTEIIANKYNAVVGKEFTMTVVGIIEADGSTEYFDIRLTASTNSKIIAGPVKSYFQGFKLVSSAA